MAFAITRRVRSVHYSSSLCLPFFFTMVDAAILASFACTLILIVVQVDPIIILDQTTTSIVALAAPLNRRDIAIFIV